MNEQNSSVQILTAATSTVSSERHNIWGPRFSAQAVGRTTSGVGAAAILIEVSNMANPTINGHWILAMTINLTLGTTDTTDGQQVEAAWRHVRARVSSISGTGASVDVIIAG